MRTLMELVASGAFSGAVLFTEGDTAGESKYALHPDMPTVRDLRTSATLVGIDFARFAIYFPGHRQPVAVPVSFTDNQLAVEADAAK